MAIKITSLEQISKQLEDTNFTYKDLHLDWDTDGKFVSQSNSKTTGNDVKVSYDISAIKNSIRNLFNTRPGQRFLFPRYGLDLYQYLFEPITEKNALYIGKTINKAIETYEPRVRPINCRVLPLPDDNQYDITLIVEFPTFGYNIPIYTTMDLKSETFIFTETSRNT